jgi:transcriptional regulator with XRE-family HTH domain
MVLLFFNFALIKETRQKESIRQADFAELLGISGAYLSMLEKGHREPDLPLIRKLIGVTAIPAEMWLSMNQNPGDADMESLLTKNSARAVAEMRSRLNREHKECQRAEERVWELEQANGHLTAENRLLKCFEDIVCNESLLKGEKQERQGKLARWTMEEGELDSEEIRAALRMERADFRRCLSIEQQAYECVFIDGGVITANSPGEAALCLRCFDCTLFESGKCLGYGNEKRPETIIEMLERLRINGVYDGIEQSRILETYHDLPLSPRELADIRYRAKKGLPIPDDVFYMDARRKRKQ